MKCRELERLVISNIKTQFILVFGEEPFVCKHLRPWADELSPARLSSGELPVIKLGIIENTGLYLVGMVAFDDAMRVLNQFPVILSGASKILRERLITLRKNRICATISISPDAKSTLREMADVINTNTMHLCCIEADWTQDDYSAATILSAATDILSNMGSDSEGGK